MPQDAFTLKHTAKELNETLGGAKIEKINQPSKDCVVFNLHNNYDNMRLVLNANADFARICVSDDRSPAPVSAPSFCMLLRKHLSRATIEKIYSVDYERIIVVDLNCRDDLGTVSFKKIYCEIMGKYSNITLVEDGIILGAMKTTGMNESLLRPIYPGAKYVLPKSQDKCELKDVEQSVVVMEKSTVGDDLAKYVFTNFKGVSYPTAEDVVLGFYERFGNESISGNPDKIRQFIEYFNDYFETPEISPTLVSDGKKRDFFIVKPKNDFPISKTFKSINALVDEYYSSKENDFVFTLKKNRLKDATAAYEKKLRKKLQIAMEKLLSCEDMEKNRLYGELLIAYLYKIKSGEKFVEVEDYTKEDYPKIKITLDEKLSPKENAERYFKRYSKQKKTVAAVTPQVEQLNEQLLYIQTIYAEIQSAETEDDFNDIEEELASLGIIKKKTDNKKKKPPLSKPRRYEYKGYEIFIGRNNIQNDRLTLSADRNDIWLHTKNYHSSHVIIKTAGRPIPDEVVLFAAELCAYFSQAKSSTAIPVDYTLKKFVKKPSGAPIGTVYYTNQKTIIVDPKLH